MPISLYDPSSDSTRELVAGRTPVLVCGPTLGAPAALLDVRRQVVSDVLARLLPFQKFVPDAGLVSALTALASGELANECEAETLRFWSLTVHYRAALRAGDETAAEPSDKLAALDDSERRLAYLYAAKKRLVELPGERIINVQTAPPDAIASLPDAVTQALERDLDTPLALAEVQEFAIAVNAMCDQALRKKGRVNASAVQAAHAAFATVEGLLGLTGEAPAAFLLRVRDRRAARQQLDVAAVDHTVARRAAARAAQDFATADRLQAELLALGVTLLDSAHGTSWTLA
jgi:cysteinyl-tRNA synthetase